MKIDHFNIDRNFNTIPVSKFWNTNEAPEIKMHRIHAYPAKFPSLVVSKSIEYAVREGFEINELADVFCGCGTTALEAKRNNINFGYFGNYFHFNNVHLYQYQYFYQKY